MGVRNVVSVHKIACYVVTETAENEERAHSGVSEANDKNKLSPCIVAKVTTGRRINDGGRRMEKKMLPSIRSELAKESGLFIT